MVRSIKAAFRLGIPALTCASLALAPHPLAAAATPHLAYSTYFPGSVRAVAVDSVGNAYVMGGWEDVFVAKLDRAGALLWWFTFGGSGFEEGKGVAVDAAGSAYVAGTTRSPDFPRVLPLQPPLSEGGEDAFLVKIDPSGSRLLFASNLGGSGDDEGVGVAVDPAGHVYLAGTTRSADFPVAVAFDPELAGPTDAFVMKLRPDLTGFVYSTYLGGRNRDGALALASDVSGEVTVAGGTGSDDFPIVSAIQSEMSAVRPGSSFVARLSPSGGSLVFSTFFGCNDIWISGVATDPHGNVSLAGTASLGPPTSDPWSNSTCRGDRHRHWSFLSRLTRAGRLSPSADIPGYDSWAAGVAVDPSGSSFVVGDSTGPEFFPGCTRHEEVFLVKTEPDGKHFEFATCLGGSSEDRALGIAADREGNIVVIGDTRSTDFPLVAPFHPTPTGSWVARFVFNDPPDCSAATASPGTLWPPNGKLMPIRVQGVEDPDGDPVTVAFTGVRQDEPLTRPGSPDATGVGTGALFLRAARAGKGDGRVYHVAFEARDPLGASCTGEVAVCVPHDSRKGAGCGDGGPLFDSSR